MWAKYNLAANGAVFAITWEIGESGAVLVAVRGGDDEWAAEVAIADMLEHGFHVVDEGTIGEFMQRCTATVCTDGDTMRVELVDKVMGPFKLVLARKQQTPLVQLQRQLEKLSARIQELETEYIIEIVFEDGKFSVHSNDVDEEKRFVGGLMEYYRGTYHALMNIKMTAEREYVLKNSHDLNELLQAVDGRVVSLARLVRDYLIGQCINLHDFCRSCCSMGAYHWNAAAGHSSVYVRYSPWSKPIVGIWEESRGDRKLLGDCTVEY